MRKVSVVVAIGVLGLMGCAVAGEDDVRTPVVDGTISPKTFKGGSERRLIVFKSDTLPGDAAARLSRNGARVRKQIGSIGVATVDADGAAATKIAADPAVASVGTERSWKVPSHRVYGRHFERPAAAPQDFLYGEQWDQRRIHSDKAWGNVSPAAQAKVTVAILDVGVFGDHPDLAGKVVDGVDTSYAHKADSGCVEPAVPPGFPAYFTRFNFLAADPLTGAVPCEAVEDSASVQDHGTHVAGTVAANIDPASGVVGVGPSLNIAAYKVFDRLHTSDAAEDEFVAFDGPLFEAIADAAAKGYPVANLSLGGIIDRTDPAQNASWQAWSRAANLATRQGLLLVAAAGNESLQTNGKNIAAVPADLPAVVSVSATGTTNLVGPFEFGVVWGPINAAPGSDVLAFYSNYGSRVDIAAPGGDCGPTFPAACDPKYLIVSSTPLYVPSWSTDPTLPPPGLYASFGWMAGTSMAAPHVAGVAGLIKAKHPSWGPQKIREQLQETAQHLTRQETSTQFGSGLVDADRATR
jgi:subtilisin family serine protease